MSRRFLSLRTPSNQELAPKVRFWLLRVVVLLNAHREFITRSGFSDDDMATLLGLGDWLDEGDAEFDYREVLAALQDLLADAEQTAINTSVPGPLAGNVRKLADLVGLSDVDCAILEFAVILHVDSVMDDVTGLLGDLNSLKTYAVLATILGLPDQEVRRALSAKGALASTGLLSLSMTGSESLYQKLELLSRHFADTLMSTEGDPLDFIRDALRPTEPPHLNLADYSHLEGELSVLRPYLDLSMAQQRRGVNIFLYGDPGTGKSQLVRALAQAHQSPLYEVACEDYDGDLIGGSKRLRALRLSQSFLARRRAFILFDEVEDVFDDVETLWGGKSTASRHKGWINRMLEENPVPTFWLSNSAAGLDPAFARRFDMIIRMPVPPKSQRCRILRQHCGTLLNEPHIERMATAESLAPAVVSRAAAVIGSISEQLGQERAGAAFEMIVNSTLETQGHKPVGAGGAAPLPDIYDTSLLNADRDLAVVAQGIREARSARLCLYGPPGTGKTAWGHWLADTLDMPLVVKRGSDLLSMWLGGTEKNIANAFREAESEGAVLMIDEVDSFLQDRRGAQRTWEITGVNEMLTNLEAFQGILIATTNLVDSLDQAALRRFDLKLCLDYLQPSQAEALLQRCCQKLQLPTPSQQVLARVRALNKLTPGDFAAVLRQGRFHRITDASELVARLQTDCALKGDDDRPIGFVH